MAGLKLPHGAWVVVCDGAKALVLENKGDAEYPDLRTREAGSQLDPPTSAIGTDAPGRVHQSVGSARSSVGQTDWHERAEEAFLKKLADHLDRSVMEKETTHLVIVAPPVALGVLRKAYTRRIRDVLLAEIDKDLTGEPVDQIEKHLFGKVRH